LLLIAVSVPSLTNLPVSVRVEQNAWKHVQITDYFITYVPACYGEVGVVSCNGQPYALCTYVVAICSILSPLCNVMSCDVM